MYTVRNGIKTAHSGSDSEDFSAGIAAMTDSIKKLNDNIELLDKKLSALSQMAATTDREINGFEKKLKSLEQVICHNIGTNASALGNKIAKIGQDEGHNTNQDAILMQKALLSVNERLSGIENLIASTNSRSIPKEFYSGSGVIISLSGLLLSIAVFSYFIFNWVSVWLGKYIG